MGVLLRFHFNPEKAAQAAAFLLRRAGKKGISKGHLVKMLYGADKKQIRENGVPLTGDDPFSLKNGPILSNVLDLLDGDKTDKFWSKHISTAAKDTHRVHLLDDSIGSDLLSESEMASLSVAWDVFNDMPWPAVVKFCHDKKKFPEWEDPGTSRIPITFERLYEAVGRPFALSEEIQMMQREEALIDKLLNDAKAACAS